MGLFLQGHGRVGASAAATGFFAEITGRRAGPDSHWPMCSLAAFLGRVAAVKPERSASHWGPDTMLELTKLTALIKAECPTLVVTFGAFAFEFVCRSLGEEGHPFGRWTTVAASGAKPRVRKSRCRV